MAGGAILVTWTAQVVEGGRLRSQDVGGLRMAFKANEPDRGTDKHLGVVGSVRFVTGGAGANFQWGMFEDEGAAFFGMATQAGGFTGSGGANLARVKAAVGLMAVGAAHGVFRDSVVVGLGKIGPTLDVAAHAEGVGTLLEETGKMSAAVDGMAVGAGEAGLGVEAAGFET